MVNIISQSIEHAGQKFFNDLDSHNDRFRFIKPYINGQRVLDIGIVQHDIKNIENPGWLHQLIKEDSKYCIGIDIHEDGINHLSDNGFNAKVANAEDFDLNDKYDTVVAGEIIEHLTNIDGFLTSIEKHLKESGHLIITTPNPFFFRRSLKIIAEGRPPVNPEHTCWFDEETLKQLLSRYNFEIEDVYYSSGEWRFRNIPLLPEKIKNTTIILIAKYTN